MIEQMEYTKEIEDLFIRFLISDPELFVRCRGITSPKYFNNEANRKVITFLELLKILGQFRPNLVRFCFLNP